MGCMPPSSRSLAAAKTVGRLSNYTWAGGARNARRTRGGPAGLDGVATLARCRAGGQTASAPTTVSQMRRGPPKSQKSLQIRCATRLRRYSRNSISLKRSNTPAASSLMLSSARRPKRLSTFTSTCIPAEMEGPFHPELLYAFSAQRLKHRSDGHVVQHRRAFRRETNHLDRDGPLHH